MYNISLIIGILISIGIFALVIVLASIFGSTKYELPEKRAGRHGERIARGILSEILTDSDFWMTNVPVFFDNMQSELDNIIVNDNGIFIIEVKNYTGELFGSEEDREWIKNKVTPAGNVYQQTIKNPIKQVKRQAFILSQILKDKGLHVWIDGYVFFIDGNSPVESPFILRTSEDIDKAVHTLKSKPLSKELQEQIQQIITQGRARSKRESL